MTLDAALNKLSTNSANAIASLIVKEGSTLICLDLRGNSLYGKGGILLGKALTSPNCRLQILRIEDTELDERGLSSICEGLKSNPFLLNLHVGANMIDSRGSRIISDSVRLNTVLSNLDLRFNKLRDEGAFQIANYLRDTQSLQGLILWKNGIGKDGMSAISNALAINRSLKVFDIGQNAIGIDGVVALKEALLVNNTLTSIGLASTKMGGEGCIALAEALETNKSLLRLDLRRNALGVTGLMALSLSLKMNTKITYIALDQAPEGDEIENRLKLDIESRCEKNIPESKPSVDAFDEEQKTAHIADAAATPSKRVAPEEPQNLSSERVPTTSQDISTESSEYGVGETITEPATEEQITDLSIHSTTHIIDSESANQPIEEQISDNRIASFSENIPISATEPIAQPHCTPSDYSIAGFKNSPSSHAHPTADAAVDYDPFDDIFSSTPSLECKPQPASTPFFASPSKSTAKHEQVSSTVSQASSTASISRVLDEFDELLGL